MSTLRVNEIISNEGVLGVTTFKNTLDIDSDLNIEGLLTANASGLTNIPASQLTGQLPALDGSLLQNLPGGGGSGGDADTLGGLLPSQFLRKDDINDFTGSLIGTGTMLSEGNIIGCGDGGGSVCMTINDGGGNANLTFNHALTRPDRNGSSGRISVNVDSTNAKMAFQLASNVAQGVTPSMTEILAMTPTSATFGVDLSANVSGNHTGNFNGGGTFSGTVTGAMNGTLSVNSARNATKEYSSGQVGSFALMTRTNNTSDRDPNYQVLGSSLRYSNANGNVGGPATGTWRLLGRLTDGAGSAGATSLWVRIA